jgi:hypothetical protein
MTAATVKIKYNLSIILNLNWCGLSEALPA